jgi:hypothetical protein
MEGVKVYEEFIGDVLLQVYRRGSWYHIKANGNGIDKQHGSEKARIAYMAWRYAAYKRIEKLPTPPSVRRDVGRLVAGIIQEDFEHEFNRSIDSVGPELQQHYAQAGKGIINRAVFAGSIYSVYAMRTRTAVPETQKQYFASLQTTKYRLPAGWKGYFAKLRKYAESVAEHAITEGGVNQLWSQG